MGREEAVEGYRLGSKTKGEVRRETSMVVT